MSAGIDYFEIERPGKRAFVLLLRAGLSGLHLVDQAAGEAGPYPAADFPVELDRVAASEKKLGDVVLAGGEDDVGRIDQAVSELKQIHTNNDGGADRFCASNSKWPGSDT